MLTNKFKMKELLQKILKRLAIWTIARYKPGIVGITGTVGKTSTKEAVYAVLSSERKVRKTPKSFNNEIGFPLTILGSYESSGGITFFLGVIIKSLIQLVITNKNYPEILVLEYGVQAPGDMKYLLDIARPQIGIVTMLGKIPVHVEFFSGPEAVAREKGKIITQLSATSCAILNCDDEEVMKLKPQTRAKVITFGFLKTADMKVEGFKNILTDENVHMTMKLEYGRSLIPIQVKNTLGKVQCYSVSAAACVGIVFGMNMVKISENLQKYESPTGRLKVIQGMKKSLIIDDTYNSSPVAVEEALHELKSLKAKRKIAVLGDMLELGDYTIEAHENIGKSLGFVDLLITLGVKAKFIGGKAKKAGLKKEQVIECSSIMEVRRFLEITIKEGDLILVKGSQGVRLEKVVKDIMREPQVAKELLVRQSQKWLQIPGLYDDEAETKKEQRGDS